MRAWLVALLLVARAALAVDFPAVQPGGALVFPRDHGAHPDYRTEWWYVTGWVEDEAGVERGFQLTFFRVRSGEGEGEGQGGRFSPAQLIFAHAAVSDPASGRLLHAQRSARASGRLAGAASGRTEVWLRDWRLREQDGALLAEAGDGDFDYRLHLRSGDPPMVNGEGGYSRKGPLPQHASYYYSRPQLAVEGALRLREREFKVRGRAWLDHEWSSELMPENAVGWDWIGVNLADGGALMAFRMRDAEGQALWSGGSLRSPDGSLRRFGPGEVDFLPRREWTSPRSSIRYVVEWQVQLPGRSLTLQPLIDDQELDSRASVGAIYWEGAVRASEAGREVGRGYLEMTGYGGRLRI